MANAPDSQPITITNAQGQQITVIPTQALQQIRPANANIIQMPNMSGLQAIPVQNIPGLGNVQVIKWLKSNLHSRHFQPASTEIDVTKIANACSIGYSG